MEIFDLKIHKGIKPVLIVLGGLALALAFSNVFITPAHAAVSCPIIGEPGLPCIFPEVGSPSAAFPPSSPSSPRLDSLPTCSDTLYRATLRWETANATSSTIELWQESTFLLSSTINYPPDGLATWWQEFINLSPGTTYSWRVKASNSYGSSTWAWGPNISVSSCSAPPAPSNFTFTANPPQCSDTTYSGVKTSFSISISTTKVEAKLFRNGTEVWNNVGNPWVFNSGYTSFEITWSNLSPETTYTWQVHAGNSAGWSSWASGPSWRVPTCPDLVITDLYTNGGKGYYRRGETVDVTITVKNQGGSAAGAFDTIYRIGDFTNCNPQGYQRKFSRSSLAAGSSVTFTDFFTAPSSYGDYTIHAMTDAYCQVQEKDETNNRKSWRFSIIQPNLFVETFELQDEFGVIRATFLPGETGTAYVKVRVENEGSEPASNFYTNFYATTLNTSCNNTTYTDRFFTQTLNYGFTAYHILSFTVPTQPGSYRAHIFTDATCVVSESNESDNTMYFDYTVDAKGGPDLVLTVAGFFDPEELIYKDVFAPNELMGMAANIKNQGRAFAYEVAVDAFATTLNAVCNNTTFSDRTTKLPNSTISITLPPDNVVPVALYFNAPSTPGDYTAYAFVDSFTSRSPTPSYCRNSESHEENNVISRWYHVLSPTGDSDSDGIRDSSDNCPYWSNSNQLLPPWYPRGGPISGDVDCDHFTTQAEQYMGTNPFRACGASAWPPDFNDDGIVQIDDVTFVAGKFGREVGDPGYTPRAELASQDGIIQIDDVMVINHFFGRECTLPDSDNDGFTNSAEFYMGTDPYRACGINAWPPDFNDDGIVQIDDVTFVVGKYGREVGDPGYTPRAELASQDGIIQIDDVAKASGMFGQSCTP